MPGPDFSDVDSLAKAQQRCARGELAKLLLLPESFGGEDVPQNVVYVPAFVVELKASSDANVIGALVRAGKVSRYSAEPSYQGKSFVPNAIRVRAWDPGEFSTEIAIWGDAL